jgi:hypothetical protein
MADDQKGLPLSIQMTGTSEQSRLSIMEPLVDFFDFVFEIKKAMIQ